MNPFQDSTDRNNLFNILTIGNVQKLKFIAQCNSESRRFEKPITRNKLWFSNW